MIQNKIL